jgi:membrane peptidoglycan carboxypeptidase
MMAVQVAVKVVMFGHPKTMTIKTWFVPLYDAWHSYNQATIRLWMSVGVNAVIQTLKN